MTKWTIGEILTGHSSHLVNFASGASLKNVYGPLTKTALRKLSFADQGASYKRLLSEILSVIGSIVLATLLCGS